MANLHHVALAPARQELFADTTLRGSSFCRVYAARVDRWLAELFRTQVGEQQGVALAATGGYGRGELSPQSDLDVVLLHDNRADIASLAERLWYPIWDEGVKLGHAVRTSKEALALAEHDLDTATSLLNLRHLAGDARLSARLADGAQTQWRRRARVFLPELAANVDLRHHRAGEVAFLLEPELKEGRGGMRDVHALRWAEAADALPRRSTLDLTSAYETLLAARVELHRYTGRASDRLLLEDQDAVAAALGATDADALMADIASAARRISWRSDNAWTEISAGLPRRWPWTRKPKAQPLGEVVVSDAWVALADDTPLGISAVLGLAVSAARHESAIAPATVERLAEATLTVPVPWPDEVRDRFVALLAEGHRAIPVIETLDQLGILVALLPEWAACRSRPQRNAYHRFTVDRHLCEAAAEAAALTDRVDRPDLLMLGALLHDIGKGYPGDHTEVGMELVSVIGPRMGLTEAETDTLLQLVRHHLLLPDVATRRDIGDVETLRAVAAEVGDVPTLKLLGALTEADSIATGPSAWSGWKAGLVQELVERTALVLEGGDLRELPRNFPTVEQRDKMRRGTVRISGDADTLTVMTYDRPGAFSRIAGALSLNALDVLEAAAYSEYGMALSMFRVQPEVDRPINWDRVCPDVQRALQGRLALDARLAERIGAYAARTTPHAPMRIVEPRVLVDNELSSTATVIEVAAVNGIGLLYRITRTLTQLDLDILRAKVQTLGGDVVDSFYVRDRDGAKVTDPDYLAEIEKALIFAMRPPRPM